mgnify:CR=1 FL=1
MAYRVVDDKWIFNDDSKLYLRNFADALKEDTLVNKEDGDFWWVKSGDAYVNVVNSSLTVHVDGGDEEDVPVNRAAALIEEALNAKAKSCGCECGCGPDCTGCECDCGCPKAAPAPPAEPEPAPPAEPEPAPPAEPEPEAEPAPAPAPPAEAAPEEDEVPST